MDEMTTKETTEDVEETHPFNKPSVCTDLVIVVEDKRLYVNKGVLMIASPVFQAMFNSEFKEKDTKEIQLPGKKIKDVVHFISCLYPDILELIGTNVYSILPLAEEYQCTVLKQRCECYLKKDLSENKAVENVIKCTVVAEKYRLADLLVDCIDVLSKKKENVVSRYWEQISKETRIEILTKRVNQLESIFNDADRLVNETSWYLNFETYKDSLKKIFARNRSGIF